MPEALLSWRTIERMECEKVFMHMLYARGRLIARCERGYFFFDECATPKMRSGGQWAANTRAQHDGHHRRARDLRIMGVTFLAFGRPEKSDSAGAWQLVRVMSQPRSLESVVGAVIRQRKYNDEYNYAIVVVNGMIMTTLANPNYISMHRERCTGYHIKDGHLYCTNKCWQLPQWQLPHRPRDWARSDTDPCKCCGWHEYCAYIGPADAPMRDRPRRPGMTYRGSIVCAKRRHIKRRQLEWRRMRGRLVRRRVMPIATR